MTNMNLYDFSLGFIAGAWFIICSSTFIESVKRKKLRELEEAKRLEKKKADVLERLGYPEDPK